MLLSVSGNRLKLSEVQLSVGLESSDESDARHPSLSGRLPAPTVLLPANCDLKQLSSAAVLDRIRNWALARAVAIAIAPDHDEAEDDDDRFQLLENDDLLPLAVTSNSFQDGNNIFVGEEEEELLHACVHKEAWSLLIKGESGATASCTGERECFTVLAHKDGSCGCLLLLPTKQQMQAVDLKKELAQMEVKAGAAVSLQLDSLQVGSHVVYRNKVKLF